MNTAALQLLPARQNSLQHVGRNSVHGQNCGIWNKSAEDLLATLALAMLNDGRDSIVGVLVHCELSRICHEIIKNGCNLRIREVLNDALNAPTTISLLRYLQDVTTQDFDKTKNLGAVHPHSQLLQHKISMP
jgi:hypothetical protein